MARFEYNKDDLQEQPKKSDGRLHGMCEVYGCHSEGHIYTVNWNCRYHHGKSGSKLHSISEALREYRSDVSWYEWLLQRTIVDYEVGEVANKAQPHLIPNAGETFVQYKSRIKRHVGGLLGIKL